MTKYITIEEAARQAQYANPSSLHRAIRLGKLKVKRFGPHATMTTQAWVNDYIASVKPRAYPRGSHRDDKT